MRRLALVLNPALDTYFGQHPCPECAVPIETAPAVLSKIDDRLCNQGQPEHFISQELSRQWQQIHDQLEKRTKGRAVLSNYVFFDRSRHQQVVFFKADHHLYPLIIGQDFNPDKDLQFNLDPATGFMISHNTGTGEELAIRELLHQLGYDGWNEHPQATSLRILTTIANEYPLVRHADLEHEGWVIATLRDNGVHTIGELQALLRLLLNQGTNYDPHSQQLIMDPDLALRAMEILRLACPTMSQDEAGEEIMRASEDRTYFQLMVYRLHQCPDFVTGFMQSAAFQAHENAFVDRHLAGLGQTHRDIAYAMLAGYYLFGFEGVSADCSNSQHYLAGVEHYHQDLAAFIANYSGTLPPLLDHTASRSDKFMAIIESFDQTELTNLPICQHRLDAATKQTVITCFDSHIGRAREEKTRHSTHQALLSVLSRIIPLAVDPRHRKGIFPTLIANVALQHVRGEDGRPRALSATWLPGNGGYLLRDGQKLPELESQHSVANPELEQPQINAAESDRETQKQEIINRRLSRSLDYILGMGEFALPPNSTASDARQLIAQEHRIMSEAPVILEYLSLSDQVPAHVRQYIGEILSGNLAQRIIETFGSLADQDPNIIGRFFPDGLHDFVQVATYRYVFDFIRGIETNLLLRRDIFTRLKTQSFGLWHPHDFSQTSQAQLAEVVATVLQDGAHRIAWLNHEVSQVRTLKDLQDKIELMFGWNTEDMKYLRWSGFWTIWNTLGGAWDCVCFCRKTVFNPRPFRAS
jgi:hypothetical protein